MGRSSRGYGARRRVFTREEDELIFANAIGDLSQEIVMNRLRCGSETLQRRANELGLQIRKRQITKRPKLQQRDRAWEDPICGYHEVPHVGDDLLLQQLYNTCGERRYESLQIKNKETEE